MYKMSNIGMFSDLFVPFCTSLIVLYPRYQAGINRAILTQLSSVKI